MLADRKLCIFGHLIDMQSTVRTVGRSSLVVGSPVSTVRLITQDPRFLGASEIELPPGPNALARTVFGPEPDLQVSPDDRDPEVVVRLVDEALAVTHEGLEPVHLVRALEGRPT